MEEKLKELYDLAAGNTSCFLFLSEDEKEIGATLVKEGYLKCIKLKPAALRAEPKMIHTITVKLIEAVVGPLEAKDLRKVQSNKFLESLEE